MDYRADAMTLVPAMVARELSTNATKTPTWDP